MALIFCPECKRQISDRAVACPHCGFPMGSGSLLDDNVEPLADQVPSGDLVCKGEAPRSRKRWRGAFAAILIFVIISVAAGAALLIAVRRHAAAEEKAIQESIEQELAIQESIKKEQEEREQERKKARAEYISNLEGFAEYIAVGAACSEWICRLTSSVWYDTLFKVSDEETIAYTQTNGVFHGDFNESLSKLYGSEDVKTLTSAMIQNKERITTLYKKLLNPEPEFKECFEALDKAYAAYSDLTVFSLAPAGSYLTYVEESEELLEEFMSLYDRFNMLIPEK